TASRELAQSIADSDFDPEIIIAVARGGLLPAGSLSYALGLKLADAINVEFYTDVHETLPDPVLLAPMLDTESIQGKRLLVVDDVADSGRTLALVLDLLREMGADARSAVLYAKSASVVAPDFVWRRTDEWIVFPCAAEPPGPPAGGRASPAAGRRPRAAPRWHGRRGAAPAPRAVVCRHRIPAAAVGALGYEGLGAVAGSDRRDQAAAVGEVLLAHLGRGQVP